MLGDVCAANYRETRKIYTHSQTDTDTGTDTGTDSDRDRDRDTKERGRVRGGRGMEERDKEGCNDY